MITTDFGDLIGARMRNEHQQLAARWFTRLLDLVPVNARDVFPTESLLDHVPALIVEISHYVCQPQAEAIASNTAILKKASELGALRHAQRASLHQVLREYQLLEALRLVGDCLGIQANECLDGCLRQYVNGVMKPRHELDGLARRRRGACSLQLFEDE